MAFIEETIVERRQKQLIEIIKERDKEIAVLLSFIGVNFLYGEVEDKDVLRIWDRYIEENALKEKKQGGK